VTSPSPTVRRRELGARLRALRLERGLTVDDVAARMEVSPAKISRIETAARGVSVADVRFLCDLYQVSTEERSRLLTLNENRETLYVDRDAISAELVEMRRLCTRHSWPVIDVTRRSIEETAAAVINLLSARRPPMPETDSNGETLA